MHPFSNREEEDAAGSGEEEEEEEEEECGCVSMLRVLDLSCNDVGPSGAIALLEAVAANGRLPLRRLSLAHNPELGTTVGTCVCWSPSVHLRSATNSLGHRFRRFRGQSEQRFRCPLNVRPIRESSV